PDVVCPLATYTGWNTRRKEVGAEGMLASLLGSCIPLPRTRDEQKKDFRGPSYPTFEAYRDQYRLACKLLPQGAVLLPEDVDLLMKNLENRRKLFPASEGK